MNRFRALDSGVEWRAGAEFLRVEEWGPGRVRVRAGVGRLLADLPGALAEARPAPGSASCAVTLPRQLAAGEELDGTTRYQAAAGTAALMSTGDLRVEISPAGMIRFSTGNGTELLAERRRHFTWPGARHFDPAGEGRYRITQLFEAYAGERLYGLGQQQHGLLDQKGAVIDLVQIGRAHD